MPAKRAAAKARINRRASRGVVTGACGGFRLPNGARRSPKVAWTLRSRILELSEESFERFWHLGPDFVIEVRSQADPLPALQRKMEEWIANGASLGWLIDPERTAVEVYRPRRDPELRVGISALAGEVPVASFSLDLTPVWNPLDE